MKRSKLPPGPKTKIPLGHLFSFRRDSIGFLKKIARDYGDIVHFNIGPIRIVLLNHPDYIKEVLSIQHQNFVKGRPLEMAKELLGEGLLTSKGEYHKRQSRIIQPAFHRQMVESYAIDMTKWSENIMNKWKDGMKVEIKDEMTNLSIMIAGSTMFSTNLEQEATEINQALENATSLFGRIPLPFSELLLKLPLPDTRKFNKAKAKLDQTIYKIINKRRQTEDQNDDLLSLLLASGGENKMSDQQLRDEALTLLLTAFDTTSTALTWTWYLLSQHPEAEAELHQELDLVLEGRLPGVQDIDQLKFTRMVFGESLRIYPPSYLIPRQAINDFSIDQYVIPGGSLILLSPFLIHHDTRFYPDPEKFNPHAWDKYSQGQDWKYKYFPFSRGPRSCIGEPFAWMQGVLVLATIAQFWRLKLVPGHRVEFLPLINLRPRYGMMMIAHRRK